MGFVDGTENPDGPDGVEAVQIGEDDPDFAGAQLRHRAEVRARHGRVECACSVNEQERVIGRTKLEDIEMPDDVKPANSHLALNVIADADGNELKIVRHNMPFGTLGNGESGTYYIGVLGGPGRARADAAQHVHRRPARQHRPHPGLLDRA